VYTVPITDKDQFLNHWDGGSPLGLADKSHSACLARVKADQTFHMGPSRGWSDIGYNTLCCPHGRLIEGRGVLTVGAQCPGYNRSGIGSQLMVGGSDKLPAAMLNRQRRFYDDLKQLRNETTRKMGHRDGYSTSCPGDEIEAWVKNGMPMLGPASPIPVPFPVDPRPTSKTAPGPHHKFPLPSGYYFGINDGTRYSVSGFYGRVFNGRRDSSWIQEFGSQLTRRGWNIRRYLVSGNDGHFGKEYRSLVIAFQKDQHLTQDGKLGKGTWRAAFENPIS
jgi:hypothetical protein